MIKFETNSILSKLMFVSLLCVCVCVFDVDALKCFSSSVHVQLR